MKDKTANARAIKRLPALRASLLWFKRETVRELRKRAETMSSPRARAMLEDKATKVSRMPLAELRLAYQAERVSEIQRAPLFELSRIVPGLVRASAHL